MTPPVILAQSLTKEYDGTRRGVEGLDVHRAAGRGARLPRPERGGEDDDDPAAARPHPPDERADRALRPRLRRDSVAIRRRIGYLPGDLRLYERLTGRELLDYFAAFRGLDGLGEAPAISPAARARARRARSGRSRRGTGRRSARPGDACTDPTSSSWTSRPRASTRSCSRASTSSSSRRGRRVAPRSCPRMSCRRFRESRTALRS